MQWDFVGSSLGGSPKESGSSLGTRREIAGKKTGGLAARLPEYTGCYAPLAAALSIGSCPCGKRRYPRAIASAGRHCSHRRHTSTGVAPCWRLLLRATSLGGGTSTRKHSSLVECCPLQAGRGWLPALAATWL
ncbi:hypothetical protein B296_00033629 [Ensete ventricosum]|uniref:Uncharacterized protein n=1 Tax=Ensete ventricosum TaxID=4639 RepID=A0A426X968_ENSVE|nr:hypothetical protein B296_00033629 [Ensete ventricosum]